MKNRFRWHIIAEFVNERGYKEIAEVGIKHCINATNVCDLCPDLSVFFCVDPNPSHLCYFPRVNKKGSVIDPRCIIRQKSNYAVKFIEDESLDLVFIDGDHSYEACKEDILLWYPKVKVGGVLCGHDYKVKAGVKQAVDELIPNCKFDADHVFILEKTHKELKDEEESNRS